MKTLAVFVALALFAAAFAVPLGHYGGHYYNDHTGNTVPGHAGDENNDKVPDYADTNRDGRPDGFHYGYYGGFPYNYHGFPYNFAAYHGAYYPHGVHGIHY